MRKVILFTILLFFIYSNVSSGQRKREEPPPLKERIFFGGNFGLQFGTVTDIQVSPVVGIWVLPRLAVAAGPDYRFFKYYKTKTNIYGGKAYLEYIILRNINSVIPIGANTNIIVHLEDELLSLESEFWKFPPYPSKRFNLNTVLAGGGIMQQIGRRASLTLNVLWALNDDPYGIYGNPEVRISFIF